MFTMFLFFPVVPLDQLQPPFFQRKNILRTAEELLITFTTKYDGGGLLHLWTGLKICPSGPCIPDNSLLGCADRGLNENPTSFR